jgi:hypothetical protein
MSEELEMTEEQISASIEALRARRMAIPAMREYKPQAKGKAKAPAAPERPVEEVFGDLIQ